MDMDKKSIIEESIRNEITQRYNKTNGKITLYLNESMEMLIDIYSDYKSQLLVDNKNQEPIMKFPRFIVHLASTNWDRIEQLGGEEQ